MFYAFSFSHLMRAFVVLIVGTILSSVVFIAGKILYKNTGKKSAH